MDWDAGALRGLRSAVHRRDGAAGLRLIRDRPLAPVLQYAGDALVAALAEGEPDAERYARKCLEELDGRGLPGDAELAADLAAALGAPRPAPALTPVPADLGTLADALEGDGVAHVLDLARGDVLEPDELEDEPAFDGESEAYDPGRWLMLPPGGPSGAGVPENPEAEERRRGAARRWLADQGYRPAARAL
ncbi:MULTISPECIES: hypothetical protein [Actinomadura]|uniref:Uncharacterized protein n=1 Tax=Actinomadura yumaensis TaxID=111807 RepID=A0ABW2CQL8_9ACTN|nr:hypothetical protein [Actinomadura sp. J1-007]MWK36264.1 hypothetical protein [Actinomadura sp. J1-007]